MSASASATASATPSQTATTADHPPAVKVMLNLAHAVDHLFLLIFAAAVAAIAADFGFAKWEDLMPYGAGAISSLAWAHCHPGASVICGAAAA